MTFFFFVSGFLFYNRLDTIQDLIKKTKSRISSLIIPFILWNVALIFYMSATGEVDLTFYNLCDYFFFEPLAGPLWYLLALFLLIMLAPFFVSLKKKKRWNTVLFVFILLLCLMRVFGIIPSMMTYDRWWWYPNVISYLPFYLCGAYLGMYFPELILNYKYEAKKYTYIGIGVLLISFLMWTFHNYERMYPWYALIELVGLWFLIKPSLFDKELPEYFSCSFYIYALHNPVLIPIFRTYSQAILYSMDISVNGIGMIIVKIIEIIFITVICYILKRIVKVVFSKKIYLGLTGGR